MPGIQVYGSPPVISQMDVFDPIEEQISTYPPRGRSKDRTRNPHELGVPCFMYIYSCEIFLHLLIGNVTNVDRIAKLYD